MITCVGVAPAELEDLDLEYAYDEARLWQCVVWDDPVNLMPYVTFVFMTHFGYSEEKAAILMMAVHNEGKATVSSGTREQVERDVSAMHSYGLWATAEKG